MESEKLLGLELLIGGASWILSVLVFVALYYLFGQAWYLSLGVAVGVWFVLQVTKEIVATIEHAKIKQKRRAADRRS